MTAPERLPALVAAELAFPLDPDPAMRAARLLAEDIVARHGDAVAAILFYGSCRRTGEAAGLLDLYVLTVGNLAFHRRPVPAFLNAVLPPQVLHWRRDGAEGPLRAKVAVMTQRAFERRMRPGSIDTTLWARFCQPTTLVHARDDRARRRTEAAVARAVETAVTWALRLDAPTGPPAAFWRHLFARTYGAELRAERGNRPDSIVATAPGWFEAVLPAALHRIGRRPAGNWRLAWALRRLGGKALNIARLVKAAFTFDGGPDYLADKIARHSGVPVELTPWQRRHPVLAAPLLLWRLRRRGAVR
ncbi:hypothetical protein MVG78_19515 (plasmid) [Roseomonas gilardii subsp. gilardii]|uniref:hypothetical protein n=1 Tax=Roseomonas gilardii TaxID=257708 RepID=UPI001FF90F7F|nr:hypothetical protein [Roseomonas gilardii]UPG74648.1 hypothetical protein MVG78_19515 [Roseomonas gilardii subsp. gilardii]